MGSPPLPPAETLHHVADTASLLRAFHELLVPGGTVCIADLDTEPGTFHTSEAAASVYHHGFDRGALKRQLEETGFGRPRAMNAHTIRKPLEGGGEGEFPVVLKTTHRGSLILRENGTCSRAAMAAATTGGSRPDQDAQPSQEQGRA